MSQSSMLRFEQFVKAPGVIHIKWISEDPMFVRKPADLFHEQEKGFPANFGRKDPTTTEQAVFVCGICDCEVKSLATIRAHCKGTRHLQNEFKFMSKIQKNPDNPESERREDDEQDLGSVHRLRKECVIGLKFLESFQDGCILYRCTLCDTVGKSEEMYEHLLTTRHRLKYFQEVYAYKGDNSEKLREEAEVEYGQFGFNEEKIEIVRDPDYTRKIFKRFNRGRYLSSNNYRSKKSAEINHRASNFHLGIVAEEELRDPETGDIRDIKPSLINHQTSSLDLGIVVKEELRGSETVDIRDLKPSLINHQTSSLDLGITAEEELRGPETVNDSDIKPALMKDFETENIPNSFSMHVTSNYDSNSESTKPEIDPVKAFHRSVAEWVKSCLYDYFNLGDNPSAKIRDRAEFAQLAKKFSHQFRQEAKDSWVKAGQDLNQIKLDHSMKEKMKFEIDKHFNN